MFAIALVGRLIGLGHTPDYDEMYHVLAAEAWLRDGTLCIADCMDPYRRGAAFTWLVAGAFRLLGVSLEAARLPSVLAGSLLVGAVFIWVRSVVGRGAAWLAAVCCALAPELITWSQMSRFYALHGLSFWCGAALIYMVVADPPDKRMRVLWLGAAAAVFFLAAHLQITTLIGLAGIALWGTGFLLASVARRHGARKAGLAALGLLVAAVGVAGLLYLEGTAQDLWRTYRLSSLMASAERDNVFFYHSWFKRTYGSMYALLPLAVTLACIRRPRPALFCAAVLATALLLHSFGGFKGPRLIVWVLPFFFTLWGLALAQLGADVDARLRRAMAGLSRGQARMDRYVRSRALASGAILAACLLFAAANVEAFQTTVRLWTVDDADWNSEPWYRGHSDWERAAAKLKPLAQESDLVVASASVKALYYLGRVDAELSFTKLVDPPRRSRPEFWWDGRVGKPVISTPESVDRLLSCYESVLIVIELGHWLQPTVTPPETAERIAERTGEVELPPGTRLKAFVWRNDTPDEEASCPKAPLGSRAPRTSPTAETDP